jgi:hypothetical protein
MKLLIETQITENYAAHNGFVGEYNWKFKGGNTYVVDGITEAQKVRIERDGIPTLTQLISENNDSYREYIMMARVVEDDAPEGEPWNTPFRLSYVDGKWVATRTIDNEGEYGGSMRWEIRSKTESYVLGESGERLDYQASWTLKNGRVARDNQEFQCELDMMEDA